MLGQANASYPTLLRSFLDEAAVLGVEPDVQGGLSLKYPKTAGRALNLGTVTKNGLLQTNAASWWTDKAVARAYNDELARLIGGTVSEWAEGSLVVRTAAGKTPRLADLLPAHQSAWLSAMRRYIGEATAHAERSEA